MSNEEVRLECLELVIRRLGYPSGAEEVVKEASILADFCLQDSRLSKESGNFPPPNDPKNP